ncbi:Predicted ATP-dependent endonuclease of the OLD family, contains P-loop ATPase and TOPRIM domains [Fodinibius roseus]|uniref:Predicted ATP-dependent endonuclease of the OLD family, contains P-loop ATPase and TOPRIM domains n=1 Tax=Fodinibius roseus TaxID=1194090 RepID=A0A1M5M349_9BACT|nr:AAA family ATPase [Fodinibius roseus]SHG71143.1 Predicted ATP-dependent endonuclease of the OLD family, contains P-loop ATPase and TOPRIM domains [Fodinibius roseus]
MKLSRLEVRNYRSIRDQTEDDAIIFDGLDCIIGKNNAGKSNILKAIQYLLNGEKRDEEIHWQRNNDNIIDVRGYFVVEERDFQLLEIENKREAVKQQMLDKNLLGICRRSNKKDLEVISLYPNEKRLQKDEFKKNHLKTWDNKNDKVEFKKKMLGQYPELEKYLTEGKEQNKGEWTKAYQKFVQEMPEEIDFMPMPAAPKTGISADLQNMLPKVISVPAVKEISDATKTSRAGELGSLLSELASEVQDDLDQAIEEAISDVYKQLNVVKDNKGNIIDERHEGVKIIEDQITSYVAENFENIGVSLEFPAPESQVMFKNAQVWIDEKGFSKVTADNVGEGVKRILIFSLFRTLADLAMNNLQLSEDSEEFGDEITDVSRSLLILYEEAELFLHPELQKILIHTFSQLYKSGAQVIFSTHSPFMIQPPSLQTINLVKKDSDKGTQVTLFNSIIEKEEKRYQNTLLQIENVSNYIFADKVLLVEGESDRLIIEKLGSYLNEEWNFDKTGIPILVVHGKGRIPLFKDFLSSLGIQVYTLLDIDCVDGIVCKSCSKDSVKAKRDEFVEKCRELAEENENNIVNADYVGKLGGQYTWEENFAKLEVMLEKLDNKLMVSDKEIGALQALIQKVQDDSWKEVLKDDDKDINKMRCNLVKELLENDILLLSGDIEDYYPDSDISSKIDAALNFSPGEYNKEELKSLFVEFEEGITDVESFFKQIFG